MDILDGLNEAQKEAVKTTEGPVLVLAGPGSGKTRALTHRVAYLIKEKNVSPFNILCVTFTNKAANEMKERIYKLFSPGLTPTTPDFTPHLPWLGTFHSNCVKILRKESHHLGFGNSFSIYDESESLSAIKKALQDLGLDPKRINPNAVKSFIEGAKSELISPKDYLKQASGFFAEQVAVIYPRYQEILKSANAFDFDDLIMKTVELFRKNPAILAHWQNLFHYILIDEYQDTNASQYVLVKILAEKRQNIFAIGDDHQSIYSFRNADFRNILNFEKDFPGAKVIKLEQNYRSTGKIVEAASRVISNNVWKSKKALWTQNEEGVPLIRFGAQDENEEAEFILNEIEALKQADSLGYGDFVLLYRTNAQSRILEEFFLKIGLPYRLVGALRFYERKEIKDILAYLKLLININDFVSYQRIVNTPPRGIGPKTAEDLNHPKVKEFLGLVEELRQKRTILPPAALIEYVINRSGYKDFILDGTLEGESRFENLKELKNVAAESERLEDFLERVALVSDVDNLESKSDAVHLMTLHCAKGLEFPVVFILGLEEGLFPHSRSLMEPAELEEERRLFYVGLTRAMKRLYLTFAKKRRIFGNIGSSLPSRFLSEIPGHLMEEV
ncbi:UvrD-helicase domain-containing protein [Candidatus Berkelbacteria bacterium]|nr:UvrD-helicase domain-containing protein [Candidatus Berkelbacteria bacterium]